MVLILFSCSSLPRAFPELALVHTGVETVVGDRTYEVAGRFGIFEGRVSQLRRKFEAAWQAFQGEAAA